MSRDMTRPTKWHVLPVKTQISLSIRPVWSEYSLSAWRKLGFLATHWAHSEDWSDCAVAQVDLSSLGAQPFCWFCHVVAHVIIIICLQTMCIMSQVMRKPVFGVFEQVRHKPACSTAQLLKPAGVWQANNNVPIRLRMRRLIWVFVVALIIIMCCCCCTSQSTAMVMSRLSYPNHTDPGQASWVVNQY